MVSELPDVMNRPEDRILQRIEYAEQALTEAQELDDLMDLRGQAEVLRALASQRGNLRIQNRAAEFKLKAERKLGEILEVMPKNPGGQAEHESYRLHDVTGSPTLSDLGIEKMQAHRWQTSALVPEEQFHAYIENCNTRSEEITSRDLYKLGRAMARGREVERLQKSSVPIPPDIEIIEADCIDWMPKHTGEFDCLIGDPPYNTGRMDWDCFKDDEHYLGFTLTWLRRAFACLKPEHHAFIFCPSEYGADIEMILRELGRRPVSRIIWHHRNLSMGRVVTNALARTYELIFHCGTHSLGLPEQWSQERFDVQIHAVPQSNFTDKKLHQAQKPLALIEWLVRIGTVPGNKVLDPFAGAGTTGLAGLSMQRLCTLVEKDSDYIAIAKGRIAEWRR